MPDLTELQQIQTEMTAIRETFAQIRPSGGFRLIMADPPWKMAMWSAKGTGKSADAHYKCQSEAWIQSLPISTLAATNCVLWLWATNPMLPQALDTIKAWGFTYKTAGTWVKRTTHGKVCFGPGYILRSANEPFLIATKGSPKTSRSVRTAIASGPLDGDDFEQLEITIEAQRREHSRKPEAGYDAAEMLVPGAHRVEVFAREKRPGWSAFGDQMDHFAENEDNS